MFDEFGGLISEDVILDAVAEVENTGIVEWAPSPRHPDQLAIAEEFRDSYAEDPSLEEIRERLTSGVHPSFGSVDEQTRRLAVRNGIVELQTALAEHASRYGRVGHNQPPEELSLGIQDLSELEADVASLSEEIEKPEPNLPQVVEKAGRLERFQAFTRFKYSAAVLGGAFVDRLVDELANVVTSNIWEKGLVLLDSLVIWLDTVISLF